MVPRDDEAYFRRRAEQELELAQRASDRAVVHAHYHLAEAYLEKLAPVIRSISNSAESASAKPLFDFAPVEKVAP